jgi:hypothetical protein
VGEREKREREGKQKQQKKVCKIWGRGIKENGGGGEFNYDIFDIL